MADLSFLSDGWLEALGEAGAALPARPGVDGVVRFVMTSTPLAVVGCGYSQDSAGYVVTGHVLAMFAPSFCH